MRFVGRDADVARLAEELAAARQGSAGRLVWLRGRRRVGKSRLVQEFCDAANVPYCFFQAPARGREEALLDFQEALAASSLPAASSAADVAFRTWTAALTAAVAGATSEQPVVLVIDELPYLVEHDPGFAADLQRAWDRALAGLPVVVIAIGSDVRMMDALVAARSPLHGRPTRELAVQPLAPSAVAEITGASNAIDAFDRYLVVGGFPQLAGTWQAGEDLESFLTRVLVDDQSALVTSAERMLASEFETALSARRVLLAIGAGEVAHGRISDRSGVRGNTLSAALEVLVDAKAVVARELPYAAPRPQKPARYRVAEPYLRFWLQFIAPHVDELARGRGDLVVRRIIGGWSTYRGHAIEPLVRESLERLLLEPSVSAELGGARHVGAFWDRTGTIEVDLVGGDQPEPTVIGFVGSVKWRGRAPFDAADAAALAAHRARIPGAEAAKLVAVTATGVAPGTAIDRVVSPDELLAAWG